MITACLRFISGYHPEFGVPPPGDDEHAGPLPFHYPGLWDVEPTTGPSRMVLAPAIGHAGLMLDRPGNWARRSACFTYWYFLDAAAATIWRTMFEAARLTLTDGRFDPLGEPVVDGRQIRNLVRLARILHPGRQVTSAQVLDVLQYGCR